MIKSKVGREYEIAFNHYLAAYYDQARALLDQYDETKNSLRVMYKFYFPADEIFTKEGLIKKRRIDVDNCIKGCQDCLFTFLNIDDSCVTQVAAMKIPSHSHWIEIIVELIGLPKIVTDIKEPGFSQLDH